MSTTSEPFAPCPRCSFGNPVHEKLCLFCGAPLPAIDHTRRIRRGTTRVGSGSGSDSGRVGAETGAIAPPAVGTGDPVPPGSTVLSAPVAFLCCRPLPPLPLGLSPLVTIGRSPDCHLVLPHTEVSRHHCSIKLRRRALLVEDEGSSNGTLVNERRVATAELKPGDVLSIGPYILEVLSEEQAHTWEAEREADRSGEKAPDVSHAMTGRIDEVPLPELLQQLEFNRRTGTLQVTSGKRRGWLVLENGKPRSAAYRGRKDDAAVFSMLRLREGRFSFSRTPELGPANMQGLTLTALLLESSRRQDQGIVEPDEDGDQADQAPPSPLPPLDQDVRAPRVSGTMKSALRRQAGTPPAGAVTPRATRRPPQVAEGPLAGLMAGPAGPLRADSPTARLPAPAGAVDARQEEKDKEAPTVRLAPDFGGAQDTAINFRLSAMPIEPAVEGRSAAGPGPKSGPMRRPKTGPLLPRSKTGPMPRPKLAGPARPPGDSLPTPVSTPRPPLQDAGARLDAEPDAPAPEQVEAAAAAALHSIVSAVSRFNAGKTELEQLAPLHEPATPPAPLPTPEAAEAWVHAPEQAVAPPPSGEAPVEPIFAPASSSEPELEVDLEVSDAVLVVDPPREPSALEPRARPPRAPTGDAPLERRPRGVERQLASGERQLASGERQLAEPPRTEEAPLRIPPKKARPAPAPAAAPAPTPAPAAKPEARLHPAWVVCAILAMLCVALGERAVHPVGAPSSDELERRVVEVEAEVLGLLGSPRAIPADAALSGALRGRVEALAAFGVGERRLAKARAGLDAQDGLAAAARGDVPLGERALALLDGAPVAGTAEAAREALRGVLAARRLAPDVELTDPLSGPAGVARGALDRALATGVARPEVHRWRARALARAGLTGVADAVTVLDDLAAADRGDPASATLEDDLLRARALLALGRTEEASPSLEAARARHGSAAWAVALGHIEPTLSRGFADEALRTLERLEPGLLVPPPPAARALGERVLARAADLAATFDGTRTPPPSSCARLLDLLRLARRLEARPPPRTTLDPLLRALDAPGPVSPSLCLGLAEVGGAGSARRRVLTRVYRELEAPDRTGGTVHLSLLLMLILDAGSPRDAGSLARVIEGARRADSRVELFHARALARVELGKVKEAQRDVKRALELAPGRDELKDLERRVDEAVRRGTTEVGKRRVG